MDFIDTSEEFLDNREKGGLVFESLLIETWNDRRSVANVAEEVVCTGLFFILFGVAEWYRVSESYIDLIYLVRLW